MQLEGRRHVTIEPELTQETQRQYRRCYIALEKGFADFEKYTQAQKMLEELDHLQRILKELSCFEENTNCLTNDDLGCRFYKVRLVTPGFLQKRLKSKMKSDDEDSTISRINMKDSQSSSIFAKNDFDKNAYVNIFQFISLLRLDSEYAISELTNKMIIRGFLGRNVMKIEDWNSIIDEFFVENQVGYTSEIFVSIRQRFF